MSDTLAFSTAAKTEQKSIPFSIDGVDFVFNPPKQAIMLMPYIEGNEDFLRAAAKWLFAGLSDEHADAIRGRLNDPKDSFDIPDLTAVVNKLDEAVAGRPTT